MKDKDKDKDLIKYFRLKPVKTAKISEISEVTASSSVANNERVNFHIGNPVQDERLISLYLRIVLNLNLDGEILNEENLHEVLIDLDWNENDGLCLQFLFALIKKSAPYMPRGGFLLKDPNYLVKYFNEWLSKGQEDPLYYDMGESSGKREIILSSGGMHESLRIFLHSLSNYLLHTPVNIFLYKASLPAHLFSSRKFKLHTLNDNEEETIEFLKKLLPEEREKPSLVFLGSIPSEITRRSLRELSLEYPVFFVEVNNAPNHMSLAREAKMMNKVLRFLTPAIFSDLLKDLSIVFIAGNSDFIKIIETVHFQFKGTPSASEVEILSFLLKENLLPKAHSKTNQKMKIGMIPKYFPFQTQTSRLAGSYSKHFEDKFNELIETGLSSIGNKVEKFLNKTKIFDNVFHKISWFEFHDKFDAQEANSLFHELIANIDSTEWQNELINSFLYAFLKHHPEYQMNNCVVVSGSSRTALGLLGFSCGIKEVIIPDLSWTYEHCIPKVTAVPLTEDYDLNVDAIILAVKSKIIKNPDWGKSGAIAINNPHNATGQIFNQPELERLIKWSLENDIFIIDDLSYQNVVPVLAYREVETIRQITERLIRTGYIEKEKDKYIITIHSLSKTDCLAGARLSVVEIRDCELYGKFTSINSGIKPNLAAIFLTYLFYRTEAENIFAYYKLRNTIFADRMKSIEGAAKNLPPERNPFNIKIIPAKGSMYPKMIIEKLPSGLSLDWLSSRLAAQGIGLIPLSTFARTVNGYEIARKSFRLTLGGVDNEDKLSIKTRRVLIDLNRIIAEESSNYNRKIFKVNPIVINQENDRIDQLKRWNDIEKNITNLSESLIKKKYNRYRPHFLNDIMPQKHFSEFLNERMDLYKQRFIDRSIIAFEIINLSKFNKGKMIIQNLEQEFYKDSLKRREEAFRQRLFDRTVHPTQMYSIKTEISLEYLIEKIIKNEETAPSLIENLTNEIISEFLGLNIAITSDQEGDELLLDLDTLIAAENFTNINSDNTLTTFISFWGDWDGSTRPSGQGHHLVSSILIKNISLQAKLLKLLLKSDKSVKIDSEIIKEMENLPRKNANFVKLLNDITLLTNHLEKKYRGILPFNIKPKKLRQIGMKLHLAKDPAISLWEHNHGLERKMLELRNQRKLMLEDYFSVNKKFRKILYNLLPAVQNNLDKKEFALEFGLFKNLLNRFIITPRIHQKIITAQDQFAIDTTAHNINEINEISAKYGNPGMILGLQISMSTKPEAIILLDRKMRSQREQHLRENSGIEIPSIWLIPLFEDYNSIKNVCNYLSKVWEYSLQSRRINQETSDRFSEIITEIFIAGSDLSQQISQAAAMALYKETKYEILVWLNDRSLIDKIRIKLGCGEPMQRQGGYYSPISGNPAFIQSDDTKERFTKHLKESTKKSTEYATTPLLGIFSGGDLRTIQSNLAEKLRYLSVNDLSQLLHHIKLSQHYLRRELLRASDPLRETRLQYKTRGLQELERLTLGRKDQVFIEFLNILTNNFRQILYGREEDVVGIHVISYFIAKTTPVLRDRPTVRPEKESAGNMGPKILEKIAETIPLSHYGSLLRAIAHNQAQTFVLGINQLTTGLFLTLDTFTKKQYPEGDAITLLTDKILPNLPVYDILHTLRIYHDTELLYLNKMEKAFPAGNSAFLALREDVDSLNTYLIYFQKELLRRHGLDVTEFFEGDKFISDLLPAVRPDLAVLLQSNLFNTSLDELLSSISGKVEGKWLEEIERLLKIPEIIKFYRSKIWELLAEPILQRISSFVELAISLYSLSPNMEKNNIRFNPKEFKFPSNVKNSVRFTTDDNMHQFLTAAFEYLSSLSEQSIEVPISIVRALKDVESIFKIEEQALSIKDQDLLRFYLLQIARLVGENG